MRAFFKEAKGIPISNILLDAQNVRFDDEEPDIDQVECRRRMLDGKDGTKLINLAEHIAKNGLSITPIVLSEISKNKYVVKDGNRRIAALTFLNNPQGCPKEHFKSRIRKLRKQNLHRGNIVSKVDCYICNDERRVLEYIRLQHTGEMEGVGQVEHQTRAKDRLRARLSGKPSRHGQVHQWLVQHKDDIEGFAEAKLTNISRITGSKKNLNKLGFDENNRGEIIPIFPDKKILIIWSCLLKRIKSVADIYHKKERELVIQAAIDEAESIISDFNSKPNGKSSENDEDTSENQNSNKSSTDDAQNATDGADRPGDKPAQSSATSPRRPSYQRNFLITENHNLKIPSNHLKVRDVLLELKKLNLLDFPISASLSLRSLLEFTLYAFCKSKGILPQQNITIKRLLSIVVKECEKDQSLVQDGKISLLHRLGNWREFESLATLHQCVHDEAYWLTQKELNNYYDRYDYIISYLWRKIEASAAK